MRIILCLIFVAVAAGATIDTLQPDATLGKDAFVYEGVPTQNFGDSDHLSVTASDGGHQAVSYIKFTGLDAYLGTTINQATLELYVTDLSYTGTILKYGMVKNDWDEGDINWQNQPWAVTGSEVQEPYPTSIDVWWTVDVTDTVVDWADGIYDHHGFVLFDDAGDGEMVRFASSDEPDSAKWPKLILDYTGSVGVKSLSLGELKAVYR